MADVSKKSCQAQTATHLSAWHEERRVLHARMAAAEAMHAQLQADSAATQQRLEAAAAALRTKIAATEDRLAEEAAARQWIEAEAGKVGLMRHLPRVPGEGRAAVAAQHGGELAQVLEQVRGACGFVWGGGTEEGWLSSVCAQEALLAALWSHPTSPLLNPIRQQTHSLHKAATTACCLLSAIGG